MFLHTLLTVAAMCVGLYVPTHFTDCSSYARRIVCFYTLY